MQLEAVYSDIKFDFFYILFGITAKGPKPKTQREHNFFSLPSIFFWKSSYYKVNSAVSCVPVIDPPPLGFTCCSRGFFTQFHHNHRHLFSYCLILVLLALRNFSLLCKIMTSWMHALALFKQLQILVCTLRIHFHFD